MLIGGFIRGLKRSWVSSCGNRISLLLIVLFAGAIGFTVGTLFDLVGSPLIGALLTNTIRTIRFILLYGIMAAIYLQPTTPMDLH